MIDIQKLRALHEPKIVALGNHPGIIQSVLDFDYLAGKEQPSIIAVVGVQQRLLRYFWGSEEKVLPGFLSVSDLDDALASKADLFLVAQSGRRAVAASEEALRQLPNVHGGMIFAEGVPEKHALHLREVANELGKFVFGPASVGMVVGGAYKLGAIGGILPEQIAQSGIIHPGNVAVISTSGGMVNELISLVAKLGGGISFAAAIGGERYPVLRPVELMEQALADKATRAIIYFGELGGLDEYEIADLLKSSKTKKPVVAYIAGAIAEKFETAPQFGHAKSMAQSKEETTSAKKAVLREHGAVVADSFADFEAKVAKVVPQLKSTVVTSEERLETMRARTQSMFVSDVSSDKGGEVRILNTPLIDFVSSRSLSEVALSMFLGQAKVAPKTAAFFDLSVKLLVDHGPQVSGAVNTMITARAGKDITAALATGILTIGPRFGGAISQAAQDWFAAVGNQESPADYVERFASEKRYISGIGHKKYRLDNPDPRVEALLAKFDTGGPHITFAKQVAAVTTKKKAQLILNVDGAIAALLLDLLSEEEAYTPAQIESLLRTDFCNAIFVFARSIGFMAHYLSQRRLDEGLFRLPDSQISSLDLQ